MQWLSHPVMCAVLACIFLQIAAWHQQRKTSNADTVDMAWALGIVISAFIYLFTVKAAWHNVLMIVLFPVLWYSRLLYHLISRYEVNHEDSRYRNLRNHWSEHTQIKFLAFFLFQAALSIIFSMTAYWLLIAPEVSVWQMLVAGLWGAFSLIGVSLADHQLLQFKRNHDSSEVCNVGLWRYSRHPNYFFEWIHWLVYPILLWETEYFWWSWLVVAIMLLFLLKFTGIPFSEQQALKKRGQAYRDYMNQTSPFVPWRTKNA